MPAPAPWWQGFFSGLVLETFPYISSPEQTTAEADFIQQALEPKPGAAILDVPCGQGRLALALAARGFSITGVDLTSEFLETGRREANARRLDVRFDQRDMRDLPWPGAFDHAFCFGNSFAYFDDAGNREFLRAVYGVLKPGGTFLLETHFVAEGVLSFAMQRRWMPLGDLYCLHETHYDPLTTRLRSTYRFIKGQQFEQKEAVYQVYLCRELLEMFEETGFSGVQAYGSLQREPFAIGSAGLWIFARRAA
jgi:ubiquinone/menaquinone biosynthesis C-methylase UbiE